jgi:hypothetical protein
LKVLDGNDKRGFARMLPIVPRLWAEKPLRISYGTSENALETQLWICSLDAA